MKPTQARNWPATWRRTATIASSCALGGAILLFSQQFITCFPPPKLLVLVAMTAFGWTAAVAAGVTLPRDLPFAWPLVAAAGWFGIGLARSASPEAFSLVFLPVAGTAAAALLVAGLAGYREERRRLTAAFVISHLLCGIYASVQYFGFDPLTWTLDYGLGRVFSSTGNPNFLAGQMALAAPVLAAVGMRKTGALKWIARVSFMLAILALIFAQTRSAWIGLAGGVTAAIALRFLALGKSGITVRPVLWILIMLATLAALYSLPIPGFNRTGISLPRQMSSIADLEQQSARQRFFWWRAGFQLFSDSPVFGHGTGNFPREFPPRAVRVAGPYHDLYPAFCDHPHNDHLFILCEHGILGFGLILWLAAVWLRLAARGIARGDHLHTGVFTGVVAVSIHAFWNMPSTIHSTIFTAGCLLGLSGFSSSGIPPLRSFVLPVSLRPAVLVVGLGIGIALAFRPAVLLTAQSYLNSARILKDTRRYGPAAFMARQALNLTAAPWRASFLLGGIMYGQHLYGEALKHFAEDERQNPWGADAILHQAKTLRQQANLALSGVPTLRDTGRQAEADRLEARASALYSQAGAHCRRALRIVPNYPEAAVTIASLSYFRAKAAFDGKRRTEARKHLERARMWLTYALRFFPRNAEALKLFGFVEIMDSNWPKARIAWTRYIQVRPEDHEMRRRLEALNRDLPDLLRKGPGRK